MTGNKNLKHYLFWAKALKIGFFICHDLKVVATKITPQSGFSPTYNQITPKRQYKSQLIPK